MNYWVIIYRVALAVVIVLVTIAMIWAFVPKINRYRDSSEKRVELQDENRRLSEEVKTLQSKQERFTSDPLFVERTAREIGMVKPDEVVFKSTNRESTAETATP
jgi:cell division protein FtsB